jgi:hypothetical protein
MLQFELLDETLDLNKTPYYHLSIQASLDGFLFAILDPGRSKYLGIKGYHFDASTDPDLRYQNIQGILDADPFLQRTYQGVSCIQVESRSTLLPAALFDRDHLKLYFEFNHVLNDLDELHYNYLKPADAYLVFPIFSEITNLYLKRWLNIRFYHQATPLADLLLSPDVPREKLVAVNFNPGHLDILAVGSGKLKYLNNFKFRSEEDALYFMLFVYDKLGLDQETTPLLISGEMDKFTQQPSRLKRYFRKLSFQTAPSGFQYPPSFQKVQEHSLLNLLRIYRCE